LGVNLGRPIITNGAFATRLFSNYFDDLLFSLVINGNCVKYKQYMKQQTAPIPHTSISHSPSQYNTIQHDTRPSIATTEVRTQQVQLLLGWPTILPQS